MSEARDTLWLVFTPACAAGNAANLRGQRAGVCVSAAIRSARAAAAMGSEIGSRGLPINAPEGSADLDESRAGGRGIRRARDRLDIGPRGCEKEKDVDGAHGRHHNDVCCLWLWLTTTASVAKDFMSFTTLILRIMCHSIKVLQSHFLDE